VHPRTVADALKETYPIVLPSISTSGLETVMPCVEVQSWTVPWLVPVYVTGTERVQSLRSALPPLCTVIGLVPVNVTPSPPASRDLEADVVGVRISTSTPGRDRPASPPSHEELAVEGVAGDTVHSRQCPGMR